MPTTESTTTKQPREFTGTVVAANMAKTVTVRVDVMKQHPKYKKSYRVSRKYHVHDEKGTALVGARVVFRECRPLSKTKRWYVVAVAK